MRRLAIGDIHGAAKALHQLLDRINYDPANDRLFFLGDYIDGWSESAQVIDTLIKIQWENPSCVFIRGNHDYWFIDFINDGCYSALPVWYNQGGESTLKSYKAHCFIQFSDILIQGAEIRDDDKRFMRETKLFHIEKDNKAFVHGGYFSLNGLGYDSPDVYMWDRDLAYMLPMRSSDPIPKVFRAHEELYIGHTATLNWGKVKPINLRGKYYNVDTGAGAKKGKLTAIDIDTKEIYQSDFLEDLYPNEKIV